MSASLSGRVLLAFFSVLALVFWVYLPGQEGGFLLDDYPNLEPLGSYGGVDNWDTFKSFVFGGFSGPTGRPLSLLTFLLDDNTWPSSATSFKLTNIFIHLLCGVALFWASFRLLLLYGVESNRAVWAGLLSASIWMLHPFMVSTTLYVVQRMAQLSTLFVLFGIVGYLYARPLVSIAPKRAYVGMAIALGLGTLLGTLSKENGALLPMLVLAIEFCCPAASKSRHGVLHPLWASTFLYVPSAAVLFYLGSRINFAENLWANRPFDQPERLLTEARIVWEYLSHLFVPQIEGRGLYQDAFVISRGLLSPWTTLPAVIGVFGLVLAGFFCRHRQPLIGLAIFFFLISHLIESTVIGLELYFEHRNYMAALFIFLPVASMLVGAQALVRRSVLIATALLLLGILSVMTWQRVQLWSDTERLQFYWAYAAPDSPRAASVVALHLSEQGRWREAEDYLEQALVRQPDSAILSVQLLLQKVQTGRASPPDFAEAARRLADQPFDVQTVMGLRRLVEFVVGEGAQLGYQRQVLGFLESVAQHPRYAGFSVFRRVLPYLRAQLYLSLGDGQEAFDYFSQALARYADTDAGLKMVSELAVAHEPDRALRLLEQTSRILQVQPDTKLVRPRQTYEYEIERLRTVLQQDIDQATRPIEKVD